MCNKRICLILAIMRVLCLPFRCSHNSCWQWVLIRSTRGQSFQIRVLLDTKSRILPKIHNRTLLCWSQQLDQLLACYHYEHFGEQHHHQQLLWVTSPRAQFLRASWVLQRAKMSPKGFWNRFLFWRHLHRGWRPHCFIVHSILDRIYPFRLRRWISQRLSDWSSRRSVILQSLWIWRKRRQSFKASSIQRRRRTIWDVYLCEGSLSQYLDFLILLHWRCR